MIDGRMLFDGWGPVARTLVVGALSYAALVVLLRVSGKRTLSKMNAFDLVVTVALGSTLASALTSRDVSLAQGVAAFALLIGLQLAITWTSVRFARVGALVKAEPRLLVLRGEPLREALRRERVTEAEVHAAVRAAGMDTLEDAEAVVLETDGSFSVVRGSGTRPR
jgi:uncharacterized membrane protein YcaP (DUF421 family)